MCMLTYYPPGVAPDPQALLNGAVWNDDGHGFAIVVDDERLIIEHGMDAEVVVANFVRQRAAHPDGPALFHSRFGTAGSVGLHNCHPFRIGGDRKTVLAHNGVLPRLVQPEWGDKRCDTRVCAEDLLRGWDLSDGRVVAEIEDWMGPHNKFVILSVNRAFDFSAIILNEKSGIWEGDTWYSNADYLDWKERWPSKFPTTVGATPGLTADDRYWLGLCEHCGEDDLDLDRGVCVSCNTCIDCLVDLHDCQCYWPPTEDAEAADVPLGWDLEELTR